MKCIAPVVLYMVLASDGNIIFSWYSD